MVTGATLGAPPFYGAGVFGETSYDYSTDPSTAAIWSPSFNISKRLRYSLIRGSWDQANTYQSWFKPFRVLGPLADYSRQNYLTPILLFDGYESLSDADLATKAKESVKWFSQRFNRTFYVQSGPELSDSLKPAQDAFTRAQTVAQLQGMPLPRAFNPPVLCMSGNGFATMIRTLYAGRTVGIPTIDVYVDARVTPDVASTVATVLDDAINAFKYVGKPANQVMVLEYGMNATYANGGDVASYITAMESAIDARGFRGRLLYALSDPADRPTSDRFGILNPDGSVSSVGAGVIGVHQL